MTVELIHAGDPAFLPPPDDPSHVKLDESRAARLKRIIGEDGLQRLADTRVCVLGLGGVGSNCVEALARGGIGSFVLVDMDDVQPSNINRQAIAFLSTVGKPKIDVMAGMIEDINPDADVLAYQWFLDSENISSFVEGHLGDVDYVIDAIDSISTKLALARCFNDLEERTAVSCEEDASAASDASEPERLHSTPLLISAMGGGNKLDPLGFRFSDLYETRNDPIARIMRKEGRKRGIDHLLVLSSTEHPVKTERNPDAARNQRSDLGTMSYIPPIMGQMLASYVIRDALKDILPYSGDDAKGSGSASSQRRKG